MLRRRQSRELDEGARFARGALWAVGPSLGLWVLAVLLIIRACAST